MASLQKRGPGRQHRTPTQLKGNMRLQHSWAPSFRRKGRRREGWRKDWFFWKHRREGEGRAGPKNPSQKEKWRKVLVLKFWEGRVREGLLKFSKSFIFMQKLAISGEFCKKIHAAHVCWKKFPSSSRPDVEVVPTLNFISYLPPSILLIRKIFEPFWKNPSEGRVREGLLRFGPKFYPSEERWRKRQKINWEGRRRKKGKNLTLLCKKKEGWRKGNWNAQLWIAV